MQDDAVCEEKSACIVVVKLFAVVSLGAHNGVLKLREHKSMKHN
jgi:hypothetical protein